MSKPKQIARNTAVRFTHESGNADDRVLTVTAREVYNNRDFYRVLEIPGALFRQGKPLRAKC